ncbi:sensor histidine kinase [Jidongwangia harbinensis]|uniref:sensor histidine kinase n=1 Tax=Jidongwangia harbinensis TaxID=2878561 RepID=UPI001CD964E3|nr:sensor histidine kinase [Jidongwangia harbinensis]MCA2212037.1 sensor histidine kinase [Jidongwangia harbinensis]
MNETPTLTGMSQPAPARGRGLPADLAVSCSVAALSTWWWHRFPLAGLLFGVLAGSVLMWRRRRPFTVLAVVAVLTAVTATIEVGGTKLHSGMLQLTVVPAMYAVIVYAATLRRAVAGGLGAWLFATLLWPLQANTGADRWAIRYHDLERGLGQVLVFGSVVWAVALSVRYVGQLRRNASERRLSAERERRHVARIAVAEERARIARELHDIVAHSLSVIILQANGAAYALEHDRDRAREALRTIGATGSDALAEIRQLVELLRGEDDGAGTSDRTPVALDQVAAVVQRARDAGVTAGLTVRGAPPDVPAGVALAVCRIVQESLTNTLKHAGPEPVATVTVDYRPDHIDIEVTDSGTGRPPTDSGGHGLVGMRERVALYGGTFEAGRHPDGGWRVRAGIPLHGAAARPVAA